MGRGVSRIMTPRQAKFVEGITKGLTPGVAAKEAGYSAKSAGQPSHRCRSPLVEAAIKAAHERVIERAVGGAEETINEINQMIAICLETPEKNMTACKGFYELRSKIKGLLIDRIEMKTVDLTGALQQAQSRADAVKLPIPVEATVSDPPATEPDILS